jgi:hypothetical protein
MGFKWAKIIFQWGINNSKEWDNSFIKEISLMVIKMGNFNNK